MREVVDDWFEETLEAALAAIADLRKQQEERLEYGIVKAITVRDLSHALDRVVIEAAQSGVLRERIFGILSLIVEETGSDLDVVHAGIQFNVDTVLTGAWYLHYPMRFASQPTATTRDAVRSILDHADREGWSIPQVQRALTNTFETWRGRAERHPDMEWMAERLSPIRTETIARTEMMRAWNGSKEEVYRSSGATHKEWLTAVDGRERESHREANGQQVRIDDDFVVGGERLMFPGDPNGSAENTINCRCTMVAVFPDQVTEPSADEPTLADYIAGGDEGFSGPMPAAPDLLATGDYEMAVLGTGISESYRALFDDGSSAVFKPAGSVDLDDYGGLEPSYNEVVTYKLAKLLGFEHLVPRTILRTMDVPGTPVYRPKLPRTVEGSLQQWVEDSQIAAEAFPRAKDSWGVIPLTGFPFRMKVDYLQMSLLDALIMNPDRHLGNWLVTGDGRLKAIDHGIGFTVFRDSTPQALLSVHRSLLGRRTLADYREALAVMDEVLESIEPWRNVSVEELEKATSLLGRSIEVAPKMWSEARHEFIRAQYERVRQDRDFLANEIKLLEEREGDK
jgi:hypothetical protein